MTLAIALATRFQLDASAGELLPAGGRQPVVLALALSLSEHFPFRRDPALALETVERRIQRSMLQAEDVVGRALDVLGDLVPVRRTEQQCAEDQHIQRALQQSRCFMVDSLPS
jgi:hypothetical protein